MKKKRFVGMGILMLFCICMLWGKTVLADPLAAEEQVAVHLTAQEEKEAEQNGKSAKQALKQQGISIDSNGFTGSETLDKTNIVTNELASAPYCATPVAILLWHRCIMSCMAVAIRLCFRHTNDQEIHW